ncbi:MAG: DUF5305 family protein [Candidatus Thermoplasmatota archaeon]|nr:DUF5305 family protein [Candidatus Thermoplasmatota archaeon]
MIQLKVKKIQVKKQMRTPVLMLLLVFIIISTGIMVRSYQASETTTDQVVSYSFTQQGLFDFTVFLTNNTVYNSSVITPQQEQVFKKLVDTIEGSFQYQYTGSENEEISGRYQFLIFLQTDHWEKKYVLIPEQYFSFYGKTSSFNFSFPINLSFYERIIDEITSEVGLRAQNPTLRITCDIVLSSETSKGYIYERFSPSVQIALREYILEFTGNHFQSETGVLTEDQEIFLPQVKTNRNTWTIVTILCVVMLGFFGLGTKQVEPRQHPQEIIVQKLKKKYAEWIVDVENLPKKAQNIDRVQVKSIEALNRLADDLGKPLLFHKSEGYTTIKQSFYVIDDAIVYEYSLEYEK